MYFQKHGSCHGDAAGGCNGQFHAGLGSFFPWLATNLDGTLICAGAVVPLWSLTRERQTDWRIEKALSPGEPENHTAEQNRVRPYHDRPQQRHCYITYRVALTNDPKLVAMESGNSEKMIRENYLHLTTKEQAQEWFSL